MVSEVEAEMVDSAGEVEDAGEEEEVVVVGHESTTAHPVSTVFKVNNLPIYWKNQSLLPQRLKNPPTLPCCGPSTLNFKNVTMLNL